MLCGGVVGCGQIGPVHVEALKKRGALAAVCDVVKEKTERFDTKKYTSYSDMLDDEDVSVVHICTPHYLHVPMAKAALEAGKYVVLEKPVGISREETEELFEYKNSDNVCIMLQNRKNPCVVTLKKIIDEKMHGELVGLNAFLTWQRTEEYYKADAWRGKLSTEGGALLINQAIHTIDLLCMLGGGYESLCGSVATRKLSNVIEAEDTADAVIKMKSGVEACFYATNCAPQHYPVRLEAMFDDGHMIEYNFGMLLDIFDEDVKVICRDSLKSPGKSYWGGGHESVINEFYDFCEGKTESFINLHSARDCMNVVFDMYNR